MAFLAWIKPLTTPSLFMDNAEEATGLGQRHAIRKLLALREILITRNASLRVSEIC